MPAADTQPRGTSSASGGAAAPSAGSQAATASRRRGTATPGNRPSTRQAQRQRRTSARACPGRDRGRGGGWAARRSREDDARHLHEGRHRQRSDHREGRSREAAQTAAGARGPRARVQQPQVEQQLAREPVHGRQPADGHRTDVNSTNVWASCVPDRPATRCARAGGVQHAAGRQEEQRLEQAVIQHVEQRPPEPRTTRSARPSERPSDARPTPITMMPMFSMLL